MQLFSAIQWFICMRPSKWTLNLETAVSSPSSVKESDKIIATFPLSGTLAQCERVEQ